MSKNNAATNATPQSVTVSTVINDRNHPVLLAYQRWLESTRVIPYGCILPDIEAPIEASEYVASSPSWRLTEYQETSWRRFLPHRFREASKTETIEEVAQHLIHRWNHERVRLVHFRISTVRHHEQVPLVHRAMLAWHDLTTTSPYHCVQPLEIERLARRLAQSAAYSWRDERTWRVLLAGERMLCVHVDQAIAQTFDDPTYEELVPAVWEHLREHALTDSELAETMERVSTALYLAHETAARHEAALLSTVERARHEGGV